MRRSHDAQREAPTEAGERLLRSVGLLLDQVESELAGLSELRDRPSGNIRITADEHFVATVLQPALKRVLPNYPDISVEIAIDYGLADIVPERFDAGVLPTYGGLYAWDFEKNSREVRVRVEGQLVFNSVIPILRAALDGLGVAYLSKDFVQPYLDRGELVQLMVDWSASSPGYHIYHPSRRQPTPAFRVILDALRHRS
jgi:DNA-binding transcriptional LysR family regulator